MWRELEARIQAPGEPTIDYFYEKVGLCRSLDLTINETRDYVLEGLGSQQQSDWVFDRRQTDIDELLGAIRDWERMRAQRTEKFDTANPTTTKQRHLKPMSTAEQSNNKSSRDAATLSKSQPTRPSQHVRPFRKLQPADLYSIVSTAVAQGTFRGIARNLGTR